MTSKIESLDLRRNAPHLEQSKTEELEQLVKIEIKHSSGCGCARHSARNFFKKYAGTQQDSEERVDLYFLVRDKMHSHCGTTGQSRTRSNLDIVEQAKNAAYNVLETTALMNNLLKEKKRAAFDRFIKIRNDLKLDGGEHYTPNDKAELIMLADTFAHTKDYVLATKIIALVDEKVKDIDLTRLARQYFGLAVKDIVKDQSLITTKLKTNEIMQLAYSAVEKDLVRKIEARCEKIYALNQKEPFEQTVKREYDAFIQTKRYELERYQHKADKEIETITDAIKKDAWGKEARLAPIQKQRKEAVLNQYAQRLDAEIKDIDAEFKPGEDYLAEHLRKAKDEATAGMKLRGEEIFNTMHAKNYLIAGIEARMLGKDEFKRSYGNYRRAIKNNDK